MRFLLLPLFLISTLALAEPQLQDKGFTLLEKSWVFSLEDELANRQHIIYLEIKDTSNTRLIDLYKLDVVELEKRATLRDTQVKDLSERLIKAQDNRWWKNTLYFLGGAALTTLITFGVNRASK